jgi:hypothetical protein
MSIERFAPPTCPHCGEPLDVFVDPGGGEAQTYIEDCAVCCRPIRLAIRWDPDAGEFTVVADADV